MEYIIFVPLVIAAFISIICAIKFDWEVGAAGVCFIVLTAIFSGVAYGGKTYKDNYYATPLTDKDIKSLGQCEREEASRRVETLKRPLMRKDIDDFERVCEANKNREKEAESEKQILEGQIKALSK